MVSRTLRLASWKSRSRGSSKAGGMGLAIGLWGRACLRSYSSSSRSSSIGGMRSRVQLADFIFIVALQNAILVGVSFHLPP